MMVRQENDKRMALFFWKLPHLLPPITPEMEKALPL
jgi:hypothetical protein